MPQDTLALCLSLPLYLRMQRPVTTLPAGHLFASGLPIEQTNETKISPSLHFVNWIPTKRVIPKLPNLLLMRILNEENHQKGNDCRPCVDYQLPSV